MSHLTASRFPIDRLKLEELADWSLDLSWVAAEIQSDFNEPTNERMFSLVFECPTHGWDQP